MDKDKIKKIVSFNCTIEELNALKFLAKESDRSLSGFVSYIIKNYINTFNRQNLPTMKQHYDQL